MIEAEAVVAQGTLKLACSRDELLRGLGIVSRGVSTRTTVQILSGILLHAAEGKLELAATDMEVSLRTAVGAKVETEGNAYLDKEFPGLDYVKTATIVKSGGAGEAKGGAKGEAKPAATPKAPASQKNPSN